MNKYITNIIILLVVIGLFLYFIHKFDKSNESNAIKKQVELSVLKANLIDSVNTDNYKIKDSILTAKSNEFTIKYNALMVEVAKAKKKDKEVMQKYDENPEFQTEICDTLINIKDKIINYQDKMILNRDSLINVKDTIILNDKILLTSKDSTINVLNINSSILIAESKKSNTWFKRNGKWVYFAVGSIATVLIIR